MESTNIFYRIPARFGSKVASLEPSTDKNKSNIALFVNYLKLTEGIEPSHYLIMTGTKVINPTTCQDYTFSNNAQVDLCISLKGGKGGFGSLLRAIGAQIEKTTNRDACRDLSGRRLRDVEREEKLKHLFALKEKLEEERKRRKEEKLKNLKKKYTDDGTSVAEKSIQTLIDMFEDKDYNRRRANIDDIVKTAVAEGIIRSKRFRSDESNKTDGEQLKKKLKNSNLEQITNCPSDQSITIISKLAECSKTDTCDKDKLANTKASIPKEQLKKSKIWLGIEDDDDSEEEERNDDKAFKKTELVSS